MAKIKLNLDPGEMLTFERVVTIPTPDGKGIGIPFVFKYRSREQLAELLAGFVERARRDVAAAQEQVEAGAEDSQDVRDQIAEGIKRDVATVRDLAVGWGVENHPFSDESLTALFNLYPGAAMEIARDYRVSLTEGRLGN